MELSFWERKTWLGDIDFCIVGSGITGLSCALKLRETNPDARILILEKGVLPQGASTKNAGFACFGSLSEILSDLETHSEEEVLQLVSDRWKGIQWLRNQLGDASLGYRMQGGYEVFQQHESALYERCLERMDSINQLLKPVFGQHCFRLADNSFGFGRVLPKLILHPLEGQLDTGSMMKAMLEQIQQHTRPVMLLNGVSLLDFEDQGDRVHLQTDQFDFHTRKLLLATNGFTNSLEQLPVAPARAQVVVTEPIPDLSVKGTFHMHEGFYYFRNIGNRILFGGGRNLDKEGETTTKFGKSSQIQEMLETLLREVILPGKPVKITHRWSGIMGVGPQKRPIIKKLSENVACGVRLGGMGVAIGSHVGSKLAALGTG